MAQELTQRDLFRSRRVTEAETAVHFQDWPVEIYQPLLCEGHHRRRSRDLEGRAGTERAICIVFQHNAILHHHSRGNRRNAARLLDEIGQCFAGALINGCHEKSGSKSPAQGANHSDRSVDVRVWSRTTMIAVRSAPPKHVSYTQDSCRRCYAAEGLPGRAITGHSASPAKPMGP